MGADAIIRVRFSPASDGLGEGGGLRGTGVAIKFTQPQTSKPQ